MKTTIEVPDDLYRRAKATAALRGKKMKDLVEEGLRLVVDKSSTKKRNSSLFDLMKDGIGIVDSGIPDLATNPKYLEDLGREPPRRNR